MLRLAQVISLDNETKHRLANPETHSQHIAMLLDGSTIPPKRRLVSSMPEDLEGFRAKYEIITNVWRMMKLRSPGRAVLVGLTENTCETHQRWLMDSKMFAMELEVTPGVLKAPSWNYCLSYEQKVRGAAMDLIRMQCLPLAKALDRVRCDQEHRMIHWVQLFMQTGQQKGHFCTSFLVKSMQLSQTVRCSSLQQPALRRRSAHEQSRPACIHGETSRGQGFLGRERSGQVSLSEKLREEGSSRT